jgi:hypothetical protein
MHADPYGDPLGNVTGAAGKTRGILLGSLAEVGIVSTALIHRADRQAAETAVVARRRA